jgi:hypothetical protein
VTFWIHVTPRARRPAVGGAREGALCVRVGEPPADGRANAACRRALAAALGVARGAVALDPAARGRRKRVSVEGEPRGLAERLRALAAGGG